MQQQQQQDFQPQYSNQTEQSIQQKPKKQSQFIWNFIYIFFYIVFFYGDWVNSIIFFIEVIYYYQSFQYPFLLSAICFIGGGYIVDRVFACLMMLRIEQKSREVSSIKNLGAVQILKNIGLTLIFGEFIYIVKLKNTYTYSYNIINYLIIKFVFANSQYTYASVNFYLMMAGVYQIPVSFNTILKIILSILLSMHNVYETYMFRMQRKKLYKTKSKVNLCDLSGKTKILASSPFTIGLFKFTSEYVQNVEKTELQLRQINLQNGISNSIGSNQSGNNQNYHNPQILGSNQNNQSNTDAYQNQQIQSQNINNTIQSLKNKSTQNYFEFKRSIIRQQQVQQDVWKQKSNSRHFQPAKIHIFFKIHLWIQFISYYVLIILYFNFTQLLNNNAVRFQFLYVGLICMFPQIVYYLYFTCKYEKRILQIILNTIKVIVGIPLIQLKGTYQYISGLRTERLVFLPSLKLNWVSNFAPSWYSLFCKQISISSGFFIINTAFSLQKFEFLHEDYRQIIKQIIENPQMYGSTLITWYYVMVGLFCFFSFCNILYFLEYVVLKVLENNYQTECDKFQKSQMKSSQDNNQQQQLPQINGDNNNNNKPQPPQSMSHRYDMNIIQENDDEQNKNQKSLDQLKKKKSKYNKDQIDSDDNNSQNDEDEEGNDIPSDQMQGINNIIISPRSPQALLEKRSTTPVNTRNNQNNKKYFSSQNQKQLQNQLQQEKIQFKQKQEEYYQKQQEHYKKNQEFLQKQQQIKMKNQKRTSTSSNTNNTNNTNSQSQKQNSNQNQQLQQQQIQKSSDFECESREIIKDDNKFKNKGRSKSTSDFECESKVIEKNKNTDQKVKLMKSSSFECESQEIIQKKDKNNEKNNENYFNFQGKMILSSDLMFTSHQNEFYVEGQQVKDLYETYNVQPQMSAVNSTRRNQNPNDQNKNQYINQFI